MLAGEARDEHAEIGDRAGADEEGERRLTRREVHAEDADDQPGDQTGDRHGDQSGALELLALLVERPLSGEHHQREFSHGARVTIGSIAPRWAWLRPATYPDALRHDTAAV